MLKDIIDDVKATPSKLATRQRDARRWLKKQIFTAREQTETSLWKLQLQALEGAGELIDRASTVPGFDKVGPSARDLLTSVERITTAPPMAEYDELNVRKIMSELRDLDRFGLLRVERYEASNKNRKTVLDAIQRETERRARLAAA